MPKQDANLFISRRSRKPVSLRFKQLGVRMYQKRYLYIMSAPAIFLLFIFHYLPMFGIVIAFQDYRAGNGFFGSEWCGLENFRYLFKTQDAWTITRNTVGYNVIFILLNTTVSILIAIVISMINSRRTAKILQSIYIMPYFLSYAIIGIIVMAFIGRNNGFITRMISGDAIRKYDFYYHTGPWPYILTFVNMWKKVGYSAVVYLAAISGISPELYEAAMLDGATKQQQVRYITLPQIKPIVVILLIMAIGNIFRGDFGLFYNVPQDAGALYPVTDVLDTYIYRVMKTTNHPGMVAAAGLYQSVVNLILVLGANAVVRKIEPDNAMF